MVLGSAVSYRDRVSGAGQCVSYSDRVSGAGECVSYSDRVSGAGQCVLQRQSEWCWAVCLTETE